MTVPTSGVVKFSHLRDEFMPVGSNMPVALSTFYRGGSYIKKNAANNVSINQAANVPISGAIKMSDFRGTAKGWVFTNAGTLTAYAMSTPFGDDWGVDWPKKLVNNGTIGSMSGGSNALTIPNGAMGRIDFVNNGSVQGAGGLPNSGGGGIALRINCNVRVYVTNTNTILGGGGAGGIGGQGGQGGDGNVPTWVYEGYPGLYDRNKYDWNGDIDEDATTIHWGGTIVLNRYPLGGSLTASIPGSFTYFQAAFHDTSDGYHRYYIYRGYLTYPVFPGAAGGAGGAGGRGQGFDGAWANGSAGAPGGNAGNNTGVGGTGGTGGTGGYWGTAGSAGATGATGASGNQTAGRAGFGGGGGGAGGYSIYVDTPWTNLGSGILYGPVGPTAPTAG